MRSPTPSVAARRLPCVLALLALLAAGAIRPAPAQSPGHLDSPATYVIVHGAWGGGWAWRGIDSLLTAQGHSVHRPTLTGLGERTHLATPDVGLDTHVQDVVNTILFEDLDDVVLVGHSYGGMVITGVADRIPGRIRRLLYLDAVLPESGESLNTSPLGGSLPVQEWVRDGLVVPPWVQPDQPLPHDVPHPLKTFSDPLVLTSPEARRLPATYILTVDPGATDDSFSPFAERAAARGWTVVRMEADHNPQWSAPGELARLFVQAGGG